MNHLGEYDVIVIGAGHAGIEAAHAAAMLGAKTAVFTLSLDVIDVGWPVTGSFAWAVPIAPLIFVGVLPVAG